MRQVWIVDQGAFGSVVDFVSAIMHCICDVGDVGSRIGFACDVDLAIVQREGVDEVLEEPEKMFRDIEFVDDLRTAITDWTEARTGRLVNVDNVCEIVPAVRIRNRAIRPVLPKERSMFLEEPTERTASWASIQPNDDLILCEWVDRWKEPEVK